MIIYLITTNDVVLLRDLSKFVFNKFEVKDMREVF